MTTRFTPSPQRLCAIAVAILLSGCAQQMIRDDAIAKLRAGQYEAAITGLETGLTRYPDSVTLRAGLVTARSEAAARLVAQSAQERIEGRLDDADKSLQRAATVDPRSTRLPAMQADLQAERRALKSLEEARALVIANKKDQALRTLEAALRDAPRHPGLLALSRQLEVEQRLSGEGAGRRALAESRPISLDFRNAPLSSLLEAITRGSGINFVLDRDVKLDSRATIYMRAGKVEDAIDMVLGAHQLARRIMDPQTVLIYPNTPDKNKEHQEQIIRVFYLAHAEAKATAGFLRAMLRIKDPFIDERANMIALRESPEVITLAERLVALHDVSEAEVMLEVEILEIKTSRLTELGINFPNSFSLTPLAAGGAGFTVNSLRELNSAQVGVSVAGLLVNLRREVGDFNTLANPRIRTKSREKAKILIGDKVPVITSTASASGFVSENVSYLDVGLKLDVEPIVSPDDEVLIKLALEVSSLAKEVRTAGGSVAYQIGTRNATTSLRLRDGETQLLGGLISNEDRSSSNRVPGLGDLPLLGRLFSSQKDDYQRSELVLAITPRIIRPAPRADIAQAELWIGTEQSTRLRQGPVGVVRTAAASTSSAPALPLVALTPAAVVPTNGLVTATLAGPSAVAAAANAPPPILVPAGPTSTNMNATAGTRMLWQGPSEVKIGDSFGVNVNVNSVAALRGVPIEIAYPANLLDVVAISEGSFLKQGDSATSFVQANNPGTGRISMGMLRNDASGATGEGTLAQVQFKAKAAGNIQLSFTSVRPIGVGDSVSLDPLPVLNIVAK
jgi:general secretion pathway protein D